MAPGLWSDRISSLAETLRSRQMKSGGWAYFDSVQESLEATCLSASGYTRSSLADDQAGGQDDRPMSKLVLSCFMRLLNSNWMTPAR
jgi:hypothetical protein